MNLDLPSLLQFVLTGFSTGCIYGLVALGYVLCFSATGVINFSQGEYVMVGALSAAMAHSFGAPLWLAVVAALAVGALVGAAQELCTLSPIRSSPDFIRVTVTFGFAVVLRGVALLIGGPDPRPLPAFSGDDVMEIFGAFLPVQVFWVWGLTAAVLVVVWYLLMRTRWGRAIRGCSDNLIAARLMGISPQKVSIVVLASGAAIGALGGAVIAPMTLASWSLGIDFGLKGFIAALLAGFRSPLHALLASLFIGIAEAVAAGLLSSGSRDVVVYGMLLAWLVFTNGMRRQKRPALAMYGH